MGVERSVNEYLAEAERVAERVLIDSNTMSMELSVQSRIAVMDAYIEMAKVRAFNYKKFV